MPSTRFIAALPTARHFGIATITNCRPPNKGIERKTAGHGPPSLNSASDLTDQTRRSTSIFLISPIALAGFRPFGQAWAQFMIVWQR